MTTKILSGTYASGYTLSAAYTGVSVTGAGVVGGATGTAGAYGGPGPRATYGGTGGTGGVGLTLPGGGTLTNSNQIHGGVGGVGGDGYVYFVPPFGFGGGYYQGGPGAGGTGGDAVLALAGATVSNLATIIGGTGGAPGVGVGPLGFGGFNNGGVGGAGVDLAAGGVVTNHGVIIGGASGGNSAGGAGVTMAAAGTITNGGASDTAALIEAGYGVGFLSAPAVVLTGGGVVTNFGTIDGYVGVSMGGPGTVINYGTIEGAVGNPAFDDAAVRFASAGDTLIAEPGSVFIGELIGGGGTLELLGVSGGSLVSVSGFGAISLGSGASCDFTGQNTLANGLTVGVGCSVAVDGTLDTFGVVTGDLSVRGELAVLAGKTFNLGEGTLTNLSAGVLTGGAFDLAAHSILQLPDNAALTTLSGGIDLNGAGWFVQSLRTATSTQIALAASLSTIAAAGKLDVQGGAAFKSTTKLTNDGTLEVGGGVMTLTSLTNLSGGILTGGTFAVDAGGVLELPGSITTLDAAIALTGAGSKVQALDPVTLKQVSLESSLTHVGATGILDILAGRSWASKTTLTNAGTIELGEGTFAAAGLVNTGAFKGSGFVAAALTNSGVVTIAPGDDLGMEFAQAVSNSGQISYALFDGPVTNTGTIDFGRFVGSVVSTGSILTGDFRAGASLAGTLEGGATFRGGSSTLKSGLVVNVGGFDVEGAGTRVTLEENVTLGYGSFNQSGGVIDTGAFTLTLSLPSRGAPYSAAISIGPGATMTGAGAVSIGGRSNVSGLTIGGTEVVTNHSTLNQTGQIIIGDGSAAEASFTNLAGAIDRLQGNVGFSRGAAAGSLYTNAGTLQATATSGVSLIACDFTSSGLAIIAAGGTLELTGPTNVLGGAVSGAGILALGGGSTTLAATVSLPVATLSIRGTDTTVALGGSRVYAGHFAQSGGTLSTGAFTLTLNGPASFGPRALVAGGGTLKLTGATTVSGALTIAGGEKASSSNTLTQTGQLVLGDASASAASFTNSGVFDITANFGIAKGGGAASSFINAGTLAKTGGTGVSRVAVAVTSTGTIAVDVGTLVFDGAVSGAGSVRIAAGTADFAEAFSENVTFTGATGVLELAKSQTYASQITGFSKTGGTSLDLLDIGFTSGTTKATYSGTTTAGILSVTDGTHTSHIRLAGNFIGSTWTVSSDGHGGTTVVDPPAAGTASAAPLASAMAAFAPAAGGPIATPAGGTPAPMMASLLLPHARVAAA